MIYDFYLLYLCFLLYCSGSGSGISASHPSQRVSLFGVVYRIFLSPKVSGIAAGCGTETYVVTQMCMWDETVPCPFLQFNLKTSSTNCTSSVSSGAGAPDLSQT